MRTGDEVRVSTPIITASFVRKPRDTRSAERKPSRSRLVIKSGIQKWSGEASRPGLNDDAGRADELRRATKSAMRCAGALTPCPALMRQSRSSRS